MTNAERYLAYARAMCRAHTLHAEASDEEGDAQGLYPYGSEEERALEVRRRRASAAWHRAMAAFFAAVAEGRDAEVPNPNDFHASPAAAVTATETNQPGAQQQ